MAIDTTKKFGPWRSFLWPIHRQELGKFIPMLLIFFLISFIYNSLRSYKDSIVVTASNAGAEALPFIKVWAVLPAALLMTFLYTRLANRFDREQVFYIILAIFLGFFALFTFVLYPAQELLHPNRLADTLQALLPSGFKGLIAIFRNWTFTLFYVMSELWSTTIFTVLFWGFANEVTPVNEAKRFYGLIGTGGNIAGIFAGLAAVYFSGDVFLSWIPYGKTPWDQSIFLLTITILAAGLAIMGIFRWLNVNVIRPAELQQQRHSGPPPKPKMSLRQNFLYLARSKYLICITLIVIAYNVVINLIEVVWKDQMKMLYPNPIDYNVYMGQVMAFMGLLATVAGFFTTGNVIRRYSWTTCALIPAVVIGASGVVFFGAVLLHLHNAAWIYPLLGISPLALSVFFGSVQNCLARASKYTIFDATKEIAFIPLSNDAKLKGKAAIDGVGSRLGKSGGSIIHQGLLITFATVGASAPYVAVIFLGAVVVWSYAVKALGKQFDQLAQENAKLHIPDAPQPATQTLVNP